MIGYRDRFVQANGLNFHYLEWGDSAKPAAVLLHGTSGNAHTWDGVSEFLAPHFRVIAVDCRNHGETDSTTQPLNPAVLVEDVEEVTKAIGLERFGLIGHSMGGRQAMSFAGHHPDRLDWLVIEDMAPTVDPKGSERVMKHLGAIPESFASIEELVRFLRINATFASDALLREKALMSRRPLVNGRMALKYHQVRPQGSALAPPATPLDLWEHIKKITCSTLILRGTESDIIDESHTDRMIEAISNAKAVAVERAGHLVHEDNPEDFKRALAGFLDLG